MRDNNSVLCEEANNFKKLFDMEWQCRVTSVAQKHRNVQNLNKTVTIPDTNDLVLQTNYMMMNIVKLMKHVQTSPTADNWDQLGKFTLCRLIHFNQRRVSEVTNLKVETYINRPDWTQSHEMFMNRVEKEISKRFDTRNLPF